MALSYLLDTNIFLEILLTQSKKEVCKKFIDGHLYQIAISDFSLHSLGVILTRNDKTEIFDGFVNDLLPFLEIVTLAKENYAKVQSAQEETLLDFDDVYQFLVAKQFRLELVTMDKDFKKVKSNLSIKFL